MENRMEILNNTDVVSSYNDFYIEEEVQAELEVAASLASLSTLGTATGCASTVGTVSCFG